MTRQSSQGILDERDRILSCVHCGLCLPACPTYVATGDENDSPRGRIYLMRQVQEEKLSPDSQTFREHIDRCLGCRACEAECPSGVEYGHLVEAARVTVETARPSGVFNGFKNLLLKWIWPVDWRRRLFMFGGRVLRDSRISTILVRSRIVRLVSGQADTALRLLEASRPARIGIGASPGNGQSVKAGHGSVAVFRGCTADLLSSVDAAVGRVLRVNGMETHVPGNQTCCGALHAHSGFLDQARALARKNIDAFAQTEGQIVTSAGGCGAMLVDYPHLLAGDTEYREAAIEFAERVKDIGQVLEHPRRVAVTSDERVAYDASCHLLHGQHAAEESLGMLRALEGLAIVPLEGANVCCGGAGIYNLLEPELSEAVLDTKIHNIIESEATIIATANPGCHMQIAQGLVRAGRNSVRVGHPIEILDHSYRSAGLYSKERG
ncbi:MAG: (Fe-S)-binding protein [Pyrinomonadaceae bacterium]